MNTDNVIIVVINIIIIGITTGFAFERDFRQNFSRLRMNQNDFAAAAAVWVWIEPNLSDALNFVK